MLSAGRGGGAINQVVNVQGCDTGIQTLNFEYISLILFLSLFLSLSLF